MTKEILRISPSGKRIGDPGLLIGPGSTGLVWRSHGLASGTSVPFGSATVTEIPGLHAMPVDLEVGRRYEIRVDTEIIGASVTASGSFVPWVRFRDHSTGAWGAWLSMQGSSPHRYTTGSITVGHLHYVDNVSPWTFTANVDAVGFGVQEMSGVPSGTLCIQPEACFARVEEFA